MSSAHDRTGRAGRRDLQHTVRFHRSKARRAAAVGSKIPVMKYAMTVALFAAAMLAAPAGHADPDPHKPDLGAHYCPGGGTVDMMSPLEPSCDGVPYEDGAYWRAINRGAPGTNSLVIVQCVKATSTAWSVWRSGGRNRPHLYRHRRAAASRGGRRRCSRRIYLPQKKLYVAGEAGAGTEGCARLTGTPCEDAESCSTIWVGRTSGGTSNASLTLT